MAEQERAPDGRVIVWRPSPGPQTALLSCPVFEALFGGARGGGKTDGVLGEWAQHASQFGEHAIGLMVRRNGIQLGETFERAKAILQPVGAKFVGSPQTGGMGCHMPGGGRLLFRHLERDQDAENYQGHSYTRVYVEEAGNFPSATPILKMMATLRSGAGVPCRMRLTANPGGPGHQWLKARYIDQAPLGWQVITDPVTGLERIYIPSRVGDNPYLGDQYVAQLKQTGSPELVRAWLAGDWDVIAGAFFTEFSAARHVKLPFAIPSHWTRFRAMDWGTARPFCVLWIAVSAGDVPGIPTGALVVYREFYGSTGEPNVGLRVPAATAARMTRAKEEPGEDIAYSVCDPACADNSGGPSIMENWGAEGIHFRIADHTRVTRQGRTGGWDQIRQRLVGLDGTPMLYVFSTCTNLIRTLPAMQHDSANPEDLDSDGEDHACFAAGTVIDGRGKVEDVGALTRCDTTVVRVLFEDGREVICTPDHRFLGEDGQWVQAQHLTAIRLWSDLSVRNTAASPTTSVASTTSVRVSDFIGRFGKTRTGQFLPGMRFITRTRIAATTRSATSNCFQAWITDICIRPKEGLQRLAGKRRRSGTRARPDETGIAGTGRIASAQHSSSAFGSPAINAGPGLRQALSQQVALGFVTPTAKLVRCVRVEPLSERQDVYCLASPSGWLSVAGGIVASNCDTLRYGCNSRPWMAPVPAPQQPTDSWAKAFASGEGGDWRTI